MNRMKAAGLFHRVQTAGRFDQYVVSAGAATLYLEMYDSVSGEILARLIDRRNMQNYGHARWASSVTNRADATRMFRRWGSLLRQAMDEQRAEAGLPPRQQANRPVLQPWSHQGWQ